MLGSPWIICLTTLLYVHKRENGSTNNNITLSSLEYRDGGRAERERSPEILCITTLPQTKSAQGTL